jgi:hypothetical protein
MNCALPTDWDESVIPTSPSDASASKTKKNASSDRYAALDADKYDALNAADEARNDVPATGKLEAEDSAITINGKTLVLEEAAEKRESNENSVSLKQKFENFIQSLKFNVPDTSDVVSVISDASSDVVSVINFVSQEIRKDASEFLDKNKSQTISQEASTEVPVTKAKDVAITINGKSFAVIPEDQLRGMGEWVDSVNQYFDLKDGEETNSNEKSAKEQLSGNLNIMHNGVVNKSVKITHDVAEYIVNLWKKQTDAAKQVRENSEVIKEKFNSFTRATSDGLSDVVSVFAFVVEEFQNDVGIACGKKDDVAARE